MRFKYLNATYALSFIFHFYFLLCADFIPVNYRLACLLSRKHGYEQIPNFTSCKFYYWKETRTSFSQLQFEKSQEWNLIGRACVNHYP